MRRPPNLTEFDRIQTQAEHAVGLFRQRYGFPIDPPVPVEMIAQAVFGLRCESRRLGHVGNETLGALCVDDKVILVDDRCSRQQYRFTVGHEVGHWDMHEGNGPAADQVEELGEVSVPHLLASMSARTKKERTRLREIEANRFAAALLMPRPFLLREANAHRVIDRAAVAQLARGFDVSMSAMLFRIMDLCQHLDWTGPRIEWDALYDLEWILTRAGHRDRRGSPGAFSASFSDQHHTAGMGARGQSPRPVPSPRESEAVQAFYYLSRLSQCESPDALPHPTGADSSGAGACRPQRAELAPWLTDAGEHLGKVLADYRRSHKRDQHSGEERKTPVIIEFTGMPNSGKDTLIEIIKDYLKDGHGYQVRVIDEAIKSCLIDRQLDAHRLFKTVAQTVAQLYEAKFENPGNYDFVIFNRGLFDRLAFLGAMRIKGEISEEQERVHMDYLLSYARLQDIAFLFLISGEESIRREMANGRGFVEELYAERDGKSQGDLRTQTILHSEMLAQLNESYLRMFRTCKDAFNHQIYLFDFTDGSDASIVEKARALADATLPRDSSQLVLPELFGLYYACRESPSDRKRAGRRSPRRRRRPEARQLSLFRDRTAQGGMARGGA